MLNQRNSLSFAVFLLLTACAPSYSPEIPIVPRVAEEVRGPDGMIVCKGPGPTAVPILAANPDRIRCVFNRGYITRWNNNDLNSQKWQSGKKENDIEFVFNQFHFQSTPYDAWGSKNGEPRRNYFALRGGDLTFFPMLAESGSVPDMITIFPHQDKQGKFAAALAQQTSVDFMNGLNASQFSGWCVPEKDTQAKSQEKQE